MWLSRILKWFDHVSRTSLYFLTRDNDYIHSTIMKITFHPGLADIFNHHTLWWFNKLSRACFVAIKQVLTCVYWMCPMSIATSALVTPPRLATTIWRENMLMVNVNCWPSNSAQRCSSTRHHLFMNFLFERLTPAHQTGRQGQYQTVLRVICSFHFDRLNVGLELIPCRSKSLNTL